MGDINMIMKGTVPLSSLMEDLGYKLSDTGRWLGVTVTEYKSPEKDSYPLDTVQRMDPNITKVYNPNNPDEQLQHVKEYVINDGQKTNCVYVEFKDSNGDRYNYIGYDTKEIEEYMEYDREHRFDGRDISEKHSVENNLSEINSKINNFRTNEPEAEIDNLGIEDSKIIKMM